MGRFLLTASALLLVAFIAFPATTQAQDSSNLSVDLSEQFTNPVPQQVGESTCHIFTATALFEAACFRKTGAHVHPSEAVLYAKHLEYVWSMSLDRIARPEDNAWADLPILPRQGGEITGTDAGDASWDLQRILSGADCVSRESFPFNEHFVDSIQKIVDKVAPAEDEKLARIQQEVDAGRIDQNEHWRRNRAAHIVARAQAVQELVRTRDDYLEPFDGDDPGIARCVNLPLQLTSYRGLDIKGIRSILDHQRVPIACDYRTRSGSNHILIVMGYDTLPTGDTKLLLRDSQGGAAPYWSSNLKGCNYALTLN